MKTLNSYVEEVRSTVDAIVKSGVKFDVGTDLHLGKLAQINYLVDMGASA